MKKAIFILATAAAITLPACAKETSATETAAESTSQTTDKPTEVMDKASYAIGANLGGSLKSDGVEINVDRLVQGIKDAIAGGDLELTQEEMGQAMQELQQQVMARREEEAAAAGGKNQAEGQEFLAKNKDAEGVVTTDSGLQYQVVTEGSGAKPTATSRVSVHYTGTLIDGTKFDSSVDRGQPAVFGVNQVIAGWTEALQLMSVGSKYKLFIPSDLAYGPSPPPGPIGPNSTLIFDVELLNIEE